MLPKTKINKTLSKDTPTYLSISLFKVTYTKQGLLLFFGGKKGTAPNIGGHHPPNPPTSASRPCRSSRSHSAPSSHRKATLAPSFWNLAAYSWKRFGSVKKWFPRSKKRGKVVDKNNAKEKMGESLELFFLTIATIFLVKKQDAMVCGWFQKICSYNIMSYEKKMRRCTYEHWPRNLLCTHLTIHTNDMGVSHRYTNTGWSLGHYTQPRKNLPPNAVWPFVCPKNHLLPIIGDVHSQSQHTAASIVPLNDPFLQECSCSSNM